VLLLAVQHLCRHAVSDLAQRPVSTISVRFARWLAANGGGGRHLASLSDQQEWVLATQPKTWKLAANPALRAFVDGNVL